MADFGAIPLKPWQSQQMTSPSSIYNYIQPDGPTTDENIMMAGSSMPAATLPSMAQTIPISSSSSPPNTIMTNSSHPILHPSPPPRPIMPYGGGGTLGYTPYYHPGGTVAFDYGAGSNNGGYWWSSPSNGQSIWPHGTLLGDLEGKLKRGVEGIVAIVRAFGSIAQMMDSALYAAWSSLMAVVTVAEHVRHLRQEHFRRWIDLIGRLMGWFLRTLRLRRGRNTRRSLITQRTIDPQALPSSLPPSTSQSSPSHSWLSLMVIPAMMVGAAALLVHHAPSLLSSHTSLQGKPVKVLHTFQPSDHHSSCLPVTAGEDLLMIADGNVKDADGWILVRRQDGSQGYMPASYAKIVDT